MSQFFAPVLVCCRDYLRIIETQIKTAGIRLSKRVLTCAANLLQIMERATRWKIENYKQSWFWIPIIKSKPKDESESEQLEFFKGGPRSLYDELQGQYCKETIRKAIDLLNSLNLVFYRHNPWNGQCRTYQYQANLERIEQLKTKVEEYFGQFLRKSPMESGGSPMESGGSPISQDQSQDLPNLNSTTTPAAAVEEKNEEPIQQPAATVEDPVPAPSPKPKPEPKLSSAAPAPNPVELFGSQLQKIQVDLNDTLISELKRWQSQPVRIASAIDYVQEQIAARWVINPTGLLIKSLREARKPRRVQTILPVEVDYSTHPMAQEWLAEIRQDPPVWVLKSPQEERDERRKFFEWAKGELLKEGIHVNPR